MGYDIPTTLFAKLVIIIFFAVFLGCQIQNPGQIQMTLELWGTLFYSRRRFEKNLANDKR